MSCHSTENVFKLIIHILLYPYIQRFIQFDSFSAALIIHPMHQYLADKFSFHRDSEMNEMCAEQLIITNNWLDKLLSKTEE